jgi:hypothetical protein
MLSFVQSDIWNRDGDIECESCNDYVPRLTGNGRLVLESVTSLGLCEQYRELICLLLLSCRLSDFDQYAQAERLSVVWKIMSMYYVQ